MANARSEVTSSWFEGSDLHLLLADGRELVFEGAYASARAVDYGEHAAAAEEAIAVRFESTLTGEAQLAPPRPLFEVGTPGKFIK